MVDNIRFITSKGQEDTYFDKRPDIEGRNLDQYWIFWAREAASKAVERGPQKMEGAYDRAFNLTTSYRRDSDIPRPFGTAEKSLLKARYIYKDDDPWESAHFEEFQTGEENIAQIMESKKDGPYATWIVSNCDETEGARTRFRYVQDMIKAGLNLDGFGHCFNRDLMGDNLWATRTMEHGKYVTRAGEMSRYKFYFAFENSFHCKDYVSEKLWRNSLGQGLVPVVYGSHPADVKEMAPKNSYIHVEDFKGPVELAEYLDYLSKNDTAYLEYHQWRKEEPETLDQFVPSTPDRKTNIFVRCRTKYSTITVLVYQFLFFVN